MLTYRLRLYVDRQVYLGIHRGSIMQPPLILKSVDTGDTVSSPKKRTKLPSPLEGLLSLTEATCVYPWSLQTIVWLFRRRRRKKEVTLVFKKMKVTF